MELTTHHYNETTKACINNMRYRHLKLQGQDEGKVGSERIKLTGWKFMSLTARLTDTPPVVQKRFEKIW